MAKSKFNQKNRKPKAAGKHGAKRHAKRVKKAREKLQAKKLANRQRRLTEYGK